MATQVAPRPVPVKPPVSFLDNTAAAGRCILVVGPYSWGRGQTVKEALRKEQKARNSKAKRDLLVYEAPAGAWITQMGDIEWKLADDPHNLRSHLVGLYIL